MKYSTDDKTQEIFPKKRCVVCGVECLPYGYTSDWGHICSKSCSEKWDSRRLCPQESRNGKANRN